MRLGSTAGKAFLAGALILLGLLPGPAAGSEAGMRQVPGGRFLPLFSPDGQTPAVAMPKLWFDETPVTQRDFLAFVKAHPRWQRDRIPAIFQDGNYLTHWPASSRLPAPTKAQPHPERQPVTYVSWFAARAFCQAQGKRLPTQLEWEYAAQAPTATILAWYTSVNPAILPPIRQSAANRWGFYDLHQLVWEWVDDFNTAIMLADSRQSGDSERQLFCGDAGNAANRTDYPAYMRYAFRSSLKPDYTMPFLGFRCARDVREGTRP